MNLKIENIDMHKGREVIYAVLSNIFLNMPSDELFANVEAVFSLFELDDNADKMMADSLKAVQDFIKSRNTLKVEEKKQFDDKVLHDYTRLFCLSDSVPVAESIYLSPSHLTMQEETGKVYYIYKSCNFDMKHTSNEPHDHISYELMFMSYLSKGIAQNIEKGDKKQVNSLLHLQKMFLEEHLLKWVEMFSKSVIGFVESVSFYAPACYFMMGFLKYDFEIVNESLS
ncbi:TorD/DmsD family molecular chaperone [Mucispirillum schaedleri]|uniref:TorD/DmsD family molecular chaperone n=1 Tax=Mucispirillum schaedleri TaxID=248039 RepID=UPI001F5698B9|nr:molecular chaperone TorD family protein [Mucispirillum schaedleri]